LGYAVSIIYGAVFSDKKEKILLLSILPVITLILIWTNSYHHLMRYDISLDTSDPYSIITKRYGPWFWVAVIYNNLLMLAGTLMFLNRAYKPPKMHHIQIIFLLICITIPWGGKYFPDSE
jgi:hypothetical protein